MPAEGALSDLTVVELGEFVAAPWCGKFFSQMGATVIKVEDPTSGDKARRAGPFPEDIPHAEKSGLFLYLNTDKLGVTLNVRTPTGRQMYLDLIRQADIVLTDAMPQDLIAWGIDYVHLREVNPRIIHVAITSFGWDGPWSHFKGNDFIAWHSGGVGYETPTGYVTDPEKEHPLKGAEYQADITTGWTAASGAMMALHHREKTGEGQLVDVSAQEASVNMVRPAVARISYGGEPRPRVIVAGSRLNRCRDGYVSLQVVNENHWEGMVRLMGEPEWTKLDIFADRKARTQNPELTVLIDEFTSQYTKKEVFDMTQEYHVPAFPIASVDEVLEMEQYRHRGFWVEVSHPLAGTYTYPGTPYHLSEIPSPTPGPAPLLGQHNKEVFCGRLGYSPQELRDLYHAGVVGPAPQRRAARQLSAVPQGAAEVRASRFGAIGRDGARPPLPLEGIRVIDFGLILAMPHATQWLAAMGAEVIKVESKVHLDNGRQAGFYSIMAGGIDGPNRSGGFNSLHYSKKTCSINMTTEEGREFARQLVAQADIVTENFTTPVTKRFGLTIEKLREVKPDIILVSQSSLGRTGPLGDAVGFGPSNQAYAGLPALTGYEDVDFPLFMGGTWPDYHIGTALPSLILAALHYRNRTGIGQWIDLSMCEMVTAALPQAFLDYQMNGRIRKGQGNRDNLLVPHNLYRCTGDDKWVAITVETEEEWTALCEVTGHPEWQADPRFVDAYARHRNVKELDALLTEWTKKYSAEEVTERLQAAGVAAAPCLDILELMANPQIAHRGLLITPPHPEIGPIQVMGVPVLYSAIPEKRITNSPLLDQDNDYVYKELLGLSDERIARLTGERVLY